MDELFLTVIIVTLIIVGGCGYQRSLQHEREMLEKGYCATRIGGDRGDWVYRPCAQVKP